MLDFTMISKKSTNNDILSFISWKMSGIFLRSYVFCSMCLTDPRKMTYSETAISLILVFKVRNVFDTALCNDICLHICIEMFTERTCLQILVKKLMFAERTYLQILVYKCSLKGHIFNYWYRNVNWKGIDQQV